MSRIAGSTPTSRTRNRVRRPEGKARWRKGSSPRALLTPDLRQGLKQGPVMSGTAWKAGWLAAAACGCACSLIVASATAQALDQTEWYERTTLQVGDVLQ